MKAPIITGMPKPPTVVPTTGTTLMALRLGCRRAHPAQAADEREQHALAGILGVGHAVEPARQERQLDRESTGEIEAGPGHAAHGGRHDPWSRVIVSAAMPPLVALTAPSPASSEKYNGTLGFSHALIPSALGARQAVRPARPKDRHTQGIEPAHATVQAAFSVAFHARGPTKSWPSFDFGLPLDRRRRALHAGRI
ncbi:MAG: hypothetical protein U1E17_06110 [Geminicoccaceae bacterium]